MLVGSYEHTLDNKGRLSLPSIFRKELESSDLIVVPAPTDEALYVFNPKRFEAWLESLFDRTDGFNPRSRKDVAIRKRILSRSAAVVLDSAGRVNLPKELCSYAHLSKSVTVIGNYDYLELWDSDAFEESQQSLSDEEFENFFFNG